MGVLPARPFAATAAAGLLFTACAWAQSADTILVNGRILTVDSRFSIREAIAICGGKIAATGATAEIRKLAGPGARVIDLSGRVVYAAGPFASLEK